MAEMAGRAEKEASAHKSWAWVRRIVGFLLATTGIIILIRAPLSAIISLWIIAAGMILLSVDVANRLSGLWNFILWSKSDHMDTPDYGPAETLAARGLYAEAEVEYEKIMAEFPDDPEPHIALIRIAVARLNNAETADKLYERGMNALQSGKSRETLTAMYKGIRTMIRQPDFNTNQTVAYREMTPEQRTKARGY